MLLPSCCCCGNFFKILSTYWACFPVIVGGLDRIVCSWIPNLDFKPAARMVQVVANIP